MLVNMVVMMVVGMMGMDKMDEDGAHAEKSGSTKQQTKAVTTPSTMPKESSETKN